MKTLTAVFLMISAAVWAEDEQILSGPILHFDEASKLCAAYQDDYEYLGKYKIKYSTPEDGFSLFSCRLKLSDGEPQVLVQTMVIENYPLPGDCFHTIKLNGYKGTWVATCDNDPDPPLPDCVITPSSNPPGGSFWIAERHNIFEQDDRIFFRLPESVEVFEAEIYERALDGSSIKAWVPNIPPVQYLVEVVSQDTTEVRCDGLVFTIEP